MDYTLMDCLTKEVNLTNEKFTFSREMLTRFMGYKGQNLPAPVTAACDRFFELMPVYIKPRAGFKIFKNIKIEADGFFCEEIFFKTEKIIARNFKQAEYLAFFALTVGPEMDAWSRQAFGAGEGLLGYTVDCGGSILAEELADKLEKRIEELAQQAGCSISHRYSPGYCGWDVREQIKLFSLLPAGFCGIQLTESALMNPVKSVSGVIGIGRNVIKKDYPCALCNEANCYKHKLRKQTGA